MATTEIEKLERRYAENPHGLTFAPLAEVHRKNGDIPRALELLRIGLELHPNYIPASIVLGRCHQDLGDLPAAEEAFSHVLRLDDENVIALKSLADINERQDKLEDAERWLRRLVSVDRSNDEARQQLQHLEALTQKERRRAMPAPAPASPVEVPHEIAIAGPAVPEPAPAKLESLDLTEELVEAQDPPAALEPAALEDRKTLVPEPHPVQPIVSPSAPVAEEEPTPLPGLVTAEFQPPTDPPEPLTKLGLEIETEEDVVLRSSGASEFSVPDASQEFMALSAQLNASKPRSPGRRASDRVADQPAATVSKQPATPTRSYAARDTKGQSIAEFFQALLVARPPEDSGTPVPTSPKAEAASVHPHQDGQPSTKDPAVSFDDFFGSAAKGSGSLAPGSSEPGKDDLDQFHTWLQNLKR